jgi:hypothetical protein
MTNWKVHYELQQALESYISSRRFSLFGDEVYESGIDCVFIYRKNSPVF